MAAERFLTIQRRAMEKYREMRARGSCETVAMQAAVDWELSKVREESDRVRAMQALEASMRFVAEVRSLGTRVMAERGGVTQRMIRKKRAACLAKIGTAVTRTSSA